ncbi:MAG: carbohydrate ABC transporter permease [Candidatus Firestonebacteria bacterium]
MKKILVYFILTMGALIMIGPFLWMILTSLKSQSEVLMMPPRLIPSRLNFENYLESFTAAPFARYFFNSIFVTVANTVLTVFTSALAGYAFAILSFKGRNILFLIFLGTMMIPMEIILIPNYFILKNLGWLDTYFALIIPWSASVFGIFLMRQFFRTLPKELFESASIDGCSHWQILWKIVFPISKPVFISVGLFSMIGSWNAFLWPLIMTSSEGMRTIPVGLSTFTSEFGTRFHLMMAAATFTTVPVIVVYLFAQRYFMEGISTSGIK